MIRLVSQRAQNFVSRAISQDLTRRVMGYRAALLSRSGIRCSVAQPLVSQSRVKIERKAVNQSELSFRRLFSSWYCVHLCPFRLRRRAVAGRAAWPRPSPPSASFAKKFSRSLFRCSLANREMSRKHSLSPSGRAREK